MRHAAAGLGDTVAVGRIGEAGGHAGFGSGGQLSAPDPGERPSVVVGCRIAYGVVGDGAAIIGRQKIQPRAVVIGVIVRSGDAVFPHRLAPYVPIGVIGVFRVIGGILVFPGELPLGVIGISDGSARAGLGSDIPHVIVTVVCFVQGLSCGRIVVEIRNKWSGSI